MGLYKKEVLIRPNSTVSVDGAKDWTKNWLNDTFQNADENKDEDGNYIDYFFADIFDSRTGNIYRVYTDACKDKYDMDIIDFNIIINENLASAEDIEKLNDRVESLEYREDTQASIL